MKIDLRFDVLLPLAQAARRHVPARRQGKPVAPSTLSRWAKNGVVVGGRRVFLEVLRTPAGAVTTARALQEFFESISDETGQSHGGPTDPLTPSELSKAVESLGEDGI
jgi:hypothetical protein